FELDNINKSNNADKLMYKDFTVSTSGSILDAFSLGVAKPLCSNLQERLKLPMLSKNGLKLAAYNSSTGTTCIFAIKKDFFGNSTCQLERDLGFASTKVEFSPDSKKITFATDALATQDRKVVWYGQPLAKKMNMNVYVLDLEKDKISKVSNNQKGNSYYPSFSQNNTVTYLNQEIDDKDDASYSLVQSKINFDAMVDNKPLDFYNGKSCDYKTEDLSEIAIGKLWFKICSQFTKNPTIFGGRFQTLSLEPLACEKLVTDYWDKNKHELTDTYLGDSDKEKDIEKDKDAPGQVNDMFNRIRSLSVTDLLLVCPSKVIKPEALVTKPLVQKEYIPNASIIYANCLGCHSTGSGRQFILDGDVEKIKAYKERALQYIDSNYMPMGAALNPEDKKDLMDYLKSL
ncbi:MAG: hypothetical protein K2Q18_02665, partial [Bdellovibrionales bacterium]|nr:hypothetical protein [Bdellovibrionales bacterium]